MNRRTDRATTVFGLVDQLFGVQTEEKSGGLVDVVQTTVTQVLQGNASRIAFTLVNLGSSTVLVWTDQQVSSERGYRLGPSGGTLIVLYDQDFGRCALPWYAIAIGAASFISMSEINLTGGG